VSVLLQEIVFRQCIVACMQHMQALDSKHCCSCWCLPFRHSPVGLSVNGCSQLGLQMRLLDSGTAAYRLGTSWHPPPCAA
jgi:hypothetical protein